MNAMHSYLGDIIEVRLARRRYVEAVIESEPLAVSRNAKDEDKAMLERFVSHLNSTNWQRCLEACAELDAVEVKFGMSPDFELLDAAVDEAKRERKARALRRAQALRKERERQARIEAKRAH